MRLMDLFTQLRGPLPALVVAAVVGLSALVTSAPAARAADSGVFTSPALANARLITVEDGVAPGASQLSAGLHLVMAPGWKTYWRSPGEVGLPPEIDWTGSTNLAETRMLWPAPTRFRAFGIENFGYEQTVVLPVTVTLAQAGAPVSLRATVDLLVCSEICVPERFDLTLDLPAGTGIDMAAAGLIAEFAAKVPETGPARGISAVTAALRADGSALVVAATGSGGFSAPDVFAELGAYTAFGPPDIRLSDGGKALWAEIPVLALDPDAPPLALTLTDGPAAVTFEAVPLSDTPPPPPYTLDAARGDNARLLSLVLVALLGGLILNVMPCVLPVLSIKLTSAMKRRDQSRARVRRGFAAAALGVLAFMWLLAGATVAARALGLSVGWGLQFQSPVFLIAMIAVLGLFAANLLGLFEVRLPQRWNTALANADGAGRGYAGDFATGAFAAVLATPCSAPFLGTAVAFALAGRGVDIWVIFTALGLGLALPYLAVAIWPGALGLLPKPGRWMLVVKAFLGLLLLSTAGWLVWVLANVAGGAVALGGVALLCLGLLVNRAGPVRLRLTVPALALGAALLLPAVAPVPRALSGQQAQTDWIAFDRGEIARRVSGGEVVFVDVTADWCLTCKANKALVLDRDPVAASLGAFGVTPMRADWTRPDPLIARYLEGNGRYGIPFNKVYGPGAPEGIALGEVLTSDTVMAALTAAAGGPLAQD